MNADDSLGGNETMTDELPAPLRVGVLEAARLIGVSRAQLYKHMKSGSIRAVKEGRHTLFTMKELRAFVDRNDPS
jgi:excisionase family DNA binding protein